MKKHLITLLALAPTVALADGGYNTEVFAGFTDVEVDGLQATTIDVNTTHYTDTVSVRNKPYVEAGFLSQRSSYTVKMQYDFQELHTSDGNTSISRLDFGTRYILDKTPYIVSGGLIYQDGDQGSIQGFRGGGGLYLTEATTIEGSFQSADLKLDAYDKYTADTVSAKVKTVFEGFKWFDYSLELEYAQTDLDDFSASRIAFRGKIFMTPKTHSNVIYIVNDGDDLATDAASGLLAATQSLLGRQFGTQSTTLLMGGEKFFRPDFSIGGGGATTSFDDSSIEETKEILLFARARF